MFFFKMKVFSYELEVCEGICDFVHGGGSLIKEICIPSLKIFINSSGIFSSKDAKSRMDGAINIQEIEVNKNFKDMVKKWKKLNKKIAQLNLEIVKTFPEI